MPPAFARDAGRESVVRSSRPGRECHLFKRNFKFEKQKKDEKKKKKQEEKRQKKLDRANERAENAAQEPDSTAEPQQ